MFELLIWLFVIRSFVRQTVVMATLAAANSRRNFAFLSVGSSSWEVEASLFLPMLVGE